ncbi:hypothetical protein [Luteipulveratus mongoliensis]|uniref:Uncharacterized protein n=1 Tax=Luteipulveratus mongoliensis TaxID=571913 RepID=A0A0K1JMS8_9MICO|nr:hypothetical protein [Luteipulveratus mongoliensis]AKU18024.1 hypothetical protein VV02_22760 [Luteipulveratus mongoliensis]
MSKAAFAVLSAGTIVIASGAQASAFETPDLMSDSATVALAQHSGESFRTGEYDITCQGPNGQFMDWHDKAMFACHGFLDKYISGNHVAHIYPDLIPRGRALTKKEFGCSVAVVSTIVGLWGGPAGASAGRVASTATLSALGISTSC